jgi:hypothetical protein
VTGPIFNQNHSGNGNNIINFGRQPFALTDAILAEILAGVRGVGTLKVEPHAVQASIAMAAQIVKYLQTNGVNATLGGGVMMMLPQPTGPLELRGNVLLVDASR